MEQPKQYRGGRGKILTYPWWQPLVIVGSAALLRKIVSSITVSWHRRQKAARLRGQEPKGEMMLLNSLPMVTVIIVAVCVVLIVAAIAAAK
jgi:hypothetical protein